MSLLVSLRRPLADSLRVVQWFLELWNVAHAVLGLIAIIFIQRALHKVLISVFLSREFKHDETNRAWWTGKWYGRGLGSHAMSQPAREFIVKIIELSLWSSDFLIGHLLLFILTPPILIPYVDRLHSMMLCKCASRSLVFALLTYCGSLVASFEADSGTAVLDQAEASAALDHRQVWHCLHYCLRHLRRVDRRP